MRGKPFLYLGFPVPVLTGYKCSHMLTFKRGRNIYPDKKCGFEAKICTPLYLNYAYRYQGSCSELDKCQTLIPGPRLLDSPRSVRSHRYRQAVKLK